MAIHNQLFHAFREDERQVIEAIELLEKKGFIVYNKEKIYATDRKVYSNK